MDQKTAEIKRLRAVVEAKDQRISELETAISGLDVMADAMCYGLSPSEARIFALMRRRGFVTRQALYSALYSDRADGGPMPKTISVLIHKLRGKIAPAGWRITPFRGQGWQLEHPQENPRGRIMRGRVLELWEKGAHSTFEIAQLVRMHEADVCRIIDDRRLGR